MNAGTAGLLQEHQRAPNVDVVGGHRVLDGSLNRRDGRLVQHVVRAVHRPPDRGLITDVALDQRVPTRALGAPLPRPVQVGAAARAEVIQDDDVVAQAKHRLDQIGSDETRAPRDEILGHRYLPTPVYWNPLDRTVSGS